MGYTLFFFSTFTPHQQLKLLTFLHVSKLVTNDENMNQLVTKYRNTSERYGIEIPIWKYRVPNPWLLYPDTVK